MADQIGDGVPAQIVTGATTKWRVTLSDYKPSDGWTVTYRVASNVGFDGPDLRAPTASAAATADGDAWIVTFTTFHTGQLRPGGGKWQAWAEKADEKYLVGSGELEIVGALETYLNWSQAERDLAIVRRALVPVSPTNEASASASVLEYEIGGVGTNRRIRYFSKDELLALETSLAQRVNAERRAAAHRKGAPYFKTIYPR